VDVHAPRTKSLHAAATDRCERHGPAVHAAGACVLPNSLLALCAPHTHCFLHYLQTPTVYTHILSVYKHTWKG
jgi:hypothetical protein